MSGSAGPSVILVSGAGTGIGAAIATRAARAGRTVIVCGRREEALNRVAAQSDLLGTIEPVVADLTRPSEVAALVDKVIARHGRLDGLVANAGIMRSGTILDTGPEEWDEVLRGNLTSAYLLRRIHPLATGDTVLLHAAAGGVGLIALQWAKLLGIRVIGTVSTEAKAEVARAYGCDQVLIHRRRALPGQGGLLADRGREHRVAESLRRPCERGVGRDAALEPQERAGVAVERGAHGGR